MYPLKTDGTKLTEVFGDVGSDDFGDVDRKDDEMLECGMMWNG